MGWLLNVLLVALALGVFLQNMHLARRVRALARASIQRDSVLSGTRLGPILGLGLDGKLRNVGWPDAGRRHSLIITFATACPVCRHMQSRWQPLVRTLRARNDWRVFWISLSSLEETRRFAHQHGVPDVECLVHPDYLSARALRMDTVPQMVAVAPEGVVVGSWTGYQPWRLDDILQVAKQAPQ